MTKIFFLRRPKLGTGSIRGITQFIEHGGGNARELPLVRYDGQHVVYGRSDDLSYLSAFTPSDYLIRWGCTSSTKGFTIPKERQINHPEAIHLVNNKIGFRRLLRDDDLCPLTHFSNELNDVVWNGQYYVVRPGNHAQGRQFYLVNTRHQLDKVILKNKGFTDSDFYLSEFMEKKQEFRVYFVDDHVICVAEKIPGDKNAPAWNHALGSTFHNVPWKSWNIAVLRCALNAFNMSGLHYGGVDVIVDTDDRAWCLEINSAASLPMNANGTPSYRQRCFAKAFSHSYINGLGQNTFKRKSDWAEFIHAGVWNKKDAGEE